MHELLWAGRTPSFLILATERNGRVSHSPQRPELEGDEPWEWCWNARDRDRWREAFVQACMFRRDQENVRVSLRLGDECDEYATSLTPVGPDLVVCRLVRVANTGLSPREDQVLDLVWRGKSNEAIAAELGVDRSTVRSYLGSIREKLGVERAEQVLAAALGVSFDGKPRGGAC